MSRKQQRFLLLTVGLTLFALAVGLIVSALDDGISYFKTPAEILAEKPDTTKRLRIGGLVVEGSIDRKEDLFLFEITDNEINLKIRYKGGVPDLFEEGQGVVLEGYLNQDKLFLADVLLAKHDENYMPKEVSDSLKQQGSSKSSVADEY